MEAPSRRETMLNVNILKNIWRRRYWAAQRMKVRGMGFILVFRIVNRKEYAGNPTAESDYLRTRRSLLAGNQSRELARLPAIGCPYTWDRQTLLR
jgi:hypothetical protein